MENYSIITILCFNLFISQISGNVALLFKNRRRAGDNYCLSTTTGSNLLSTPCTVSTTNYIVHDINQRLYLVKSDMCLQSDGIADSLISLAPCSNSPNQTWIRDQRERYSLLSSNQTMCLDLQGITTSYYLPAVVKSCGSALGQKWYRTPCNVDLKSNIIGCACNMDEGECKKSLILKNRGGNPENLCIQSNSSDSSSLLSSLCELDTPSQTFTYDNDYRLVISSDGRCLEVSNSSFVTLAPCSNSLLQKWQWDAQDRIRFYSNTSQCLDLAVNTLYSPLILKECSLALSQQWYRVYCSNAFQPNRTLECEFCPNGFYKNIKGNSKCLACPDGLQTDQHGTGCLRWDIHYGVVTIAGQPNIMGGDDGYGTAATLTKPLDLVIDNDNNIVYFAEFNANKIRMINSTGYVSTVAGNGSKTAFDGQGTFASFKGPGGLLLDNNGLLYIGDHAGSRISVIDKNFNVNTVVSSEVQGTADGPFGKARLHPILGMVWKNGDIICTQTSITGKLRRVSMKEQYVDTYAGTDETGRTNGFRLKATFNVPYLLGSDPEENIYVGDRSNNLIRLINATTGEVSTFLGAETQGNLDGFGTYASLWLIDDIQYDKITNGFYISERHQKRIRWVSREGNATTLPIHGLNLPIGLAVDKQGNILVCDNLDNTIKKIIPCPLNAIWDRRLLQCQCRPGFEYDTITNTCNKCLPGTVKANNDNGNCTTCPVDTEPLPDQTGCSKCQSGTFRAYPNMPRCLPCSVNSICTMTETKCVPGYEYDQQLHECRKCRDGFIQKDVISVDQNCTQCPIGFGSDFNRTECQPCPLGKSFKPSLTIETCIDCPEGAVCSTPFTRTCQAGYEPQGDVICQLCDRTSFKLNPGNFICSNCATGSFSSDDRTECLLCPAGSYLVSLDTGACEKCGAGLQTNKNRTACVECPLNMYKPSNQYSFCLKCPYGAVCDSVSFTCRPGYYFDSKNSRNCRECPLGTFKSTTDNSITCAKCPVGTQSTASRSECNACPDGFFRSSDTNYPYCIACPSSFTSHCDRFGFTCSPGYVKSASMETCIEKSPNVDSEPTMSILLVRKTEANEAEWDISLPLSVSIVVISAMTLILMIVTVSVRVKAYLLSKMKFMERKELEDESTHASTMSVKSLTRLTGETPFDYATD